MGIVGQTQKSTRDILLKELALVLGLLFIGLVFLPVAVFFVGDQVFGEYGGAGFTGFFNALGSELRSLNWVAWFLVLSPYLAWQTLRLTRFLWQAIGHSYTGKKTAGN